MPLAQQQDPVQQATGGGGITIQLPTIDLTKIIPDLVQPFLAKLAETVGDVALAIWNAIIGSGFNLITRTAPEWLSTNKDVLALANELTTAINGITALAVVILGLGIIGRYFWGSSWAPVEGAKNIVLGVLYCGAAVRFCTWSVALVQSVNDGLGGESLSKPPQILITGSPVDLVVSVILLVPWVVVGLLLWLFMAQRLGMLAVLFVLAPVALAVWAVPQTRWITVTWARLWFGWLVAQPLALVCLKFAAVMAGLFGGGSTSVFFGIAMLLTARKAAQLFIPAGAGDWGGAVAQVGMRLALRR